MKNIFTKRALNRRDPVIVELFIFLKLQQNGVSLKFTQPKSIRNFQNSLLRQILPMLVSAITISRATAHYHGEDQVLG